MRAEMQRTMNNGSNTYDDRKQTELEIDNQRGSFKTSEPINADVNEIKPRPRNDFGGKKIVEQEDLLTVLTTKTRSRYVFQFFFFFEIEKIIIN